jgi:hypothetical protein
MLLSLYIFIIRVQERSFFGQSLLSCLDVSTYQTVMPGQSTNFRLSVLGILDLIFHILNFNISSYKSHTHLRTFPELSHRTLEWYG